MSAIVMRRLSIKEYARLCSEHFKRYWWQYTLPVAVVFVLQLFIRVDVNLTESLPDKVFITVKGYTRNIQYGDYVAFEWPGGGPFPKGFHFVKIVLGVPGDEIYMDEGRNFYLIKKHDLEVLNRMGFDKRHLGKAKPFSKKGLPLEPGPTGVIPPGYFYVYAPHPDSLDSRYALTGWIPHEAILGKTYAIF